MKVAGLFAGIGGVELGLDRAGHSTELVCEIWDPALAVLKDKFEGVDFCRDVRTMTSVPADINLITAGFPCQDLSQAGKTRGIDGERSGLVDHVFKLLDDRAVEWVLLENVPFMLTLERGRAMHRLVSEFEARNYRWAYRVVNSQSFVPQRRERVFFLATNGDSDPAEILLADEVQPPKLATELDRRAHGFYWTEGLRGLGWAIDAVPPLKNGSTIGIPSPPAIILPDGEVVTPDIRDAERLQGFESDWTRAAEEVARPSVRWSLVGNAVTVDAAEWIGARLKNPGEFERDRDRILDGARWPKACRYDGHDRYAVEINSTPKWLPREPLVDFLKFAGKPLSERATKGFLGRTERAKLRFPHGFQDRLRDHLAKQETAKGAA